MLVALAVAQFLVSTLHAGDIWHQTIVGFLSTRDTPRGAIIFFGTDTNNPGNTMEKSLIILSVSSKVAKTRVEHFLKIPLRLFLLIQCSYGAYILFGDGNVLFASHRSVIYILFGLLISNRMFIYQITSAITYLSGFFKSFKHAGSNPSFSRVFCRYRQA